ncbi:contact-dependent growth inhibition system immunity protein [Flavobacterium sp. UGB4466]|uniref:contact-dependent growth inhibition system immunity protein n=1 Tax=Flavobacterium sp. UGB4466 TaxID=2730889 RepID=UPI001ED93A0E|nr:contact-dependent growth inhibition system immunity protein [Flavobacterium sp. UGB4466]
MLQLNLSNKIMTKSVVLKKFKKDNRYVLHPNLIVKDSGSFAIAPYIIEHNLNYDELLDKVLYALEFSTEGEQPLEDHKTRLSEYLKGIGVKTIKALHDNSINLSLYVRDGIINFVPWENMGSKRGFVGYSDDLTVRLPFDSSKEELTKALELALSRCK